MARRESARAVRQDCFLRERPSPFVPVMAKQRQFAAPAAVMQLAKASWQAKSRARLRVLLPANCRTKVMLLVPELARQPLRWAGWRPPLLVLQAQAKRVNQREPLQAKSRVRAKLLVTASGWRLPLLEPQD
jgi:hypothetical protein